MTDRCKGVVLAAGQGLRLRPFTDHYPKPLVPFAGTTPLELALWRLWRVGIHDVAINSHHLAGQIRAYIKDSPLAGGRSSSEVLRLHESREPILLGTGGAFNPLRSWAGDADLVVINGDVVADFDLTALVAHHRRVNAVATMMLLPSVIPGESTIYHTGGRLCGIGPGFEANAAGITDLGRSNFACAQVLSPQFLDLLPRQGTFDIIKGGYLPALSQGLPIAVLQHQSYWHDLRTPSFYWQALVELLGSAPVFESLGLTDLHALRHSLGLLKPHRWLASDARIGDGVRCFGTVVVEAGARVGAGAALENCILLPGADVPPGSVAKLCILGAGTLRMDVVPIPADVA